MRRAFSFGCLVLGLVGLGCGDDEAAGQRECDLTLEQWCGDHACAGIETFDDALATVLDDHEARGLGWIYACEEQAQVAFADGMQQLAKMYSYDLESGELVGGEVADVREASDSCERRRRSAGEPLDCSDSCLLLGIAPESTLEVDACEGELAEPLIEMCLDDPPAWIEGCEECACPRCYPALLKAESNTLSEAAAFMCAMDFCPDECAAQLEAANLGQL
jgi:hypothetical protein